MNQLPLSSRTQIVSLLVEGNSLRSISRITGCSINTVTKLLVSVGQACDKFHNETVKKVTSQKVQCDEIWSFVYAKQKNVPDSMQEVDGIGDVWTWTALDAESKLIISWYVGDRSTDSAKEFMQDVASRLANRVQLTTDGHKAYLEAVWDSFRGDIDYAMLIKIYGNGEEGSEKRYSPAECTGTKTARIAGFPDSKHISTSHVERQNLTMRMGMRRFTRLTNAFSKKIENHCFAIALHFVHYNFCRIHKTLRVTPAMEAGLMKNVMSLEDIVRLT